jgi:transposase
MAEMTWTPEQRRRYAPAISDIARTNALTRLVGIIDAIDPLAAIGRPRVWSTLIMLQALWWITRSGAAWRFLPAGYPPPQSVDSRLARWVRHGALDRALALLNACIRLAKGRPKRPSALDRCAIEHRHAERAARPPGRAARLRRRQEDQGQEARAAGRHPGPDPRPARDRASVQDWDTLAAVEPELAAASRMTKLWADLDFNGDVPVEVAIRVGVDLDLVGRRHKIGFALDPRRWIVEQDFGKLARYRGLAVDHEASLEKSRTMTLAAAVFMTAHAFERMVMA